MKGSRSFIYILFIFLSESEWIIIIFVALGYVNIHHYLVESGEMGLCFAESHFRSVQKHVCLFFVFCFYWKHAVSAEIFYNGHIWWLCFFVWFLKKRDWLHKRIASHSAEKIQCNLCIISVNRASSQIA